MPFGNYVEVEAGIRCMVRSWRRVPDQSLPARAKITGSDAQAALAKSEAVEGGFDEAIVLSVDGHVSEGSAENVFMLKDGAFVTPPVTDDILEGAVRSEEHTSELQSRFDLVCRLLLEKKKKKK